MTRSGRGRPPGSPPCAATPHTTGCGALERRRGREGELSPDLPDPAPGPEEEVLRRERTRALRQALAGLRTRDRDLFYRKYYYLQSTDRIAAELGTSPRAVEGRLYRIRKKLQAQLGGEDL